MNTERSGFPHGVVLIDKPVGCTSFDVVERIKRLVRPLKVGHAGTLDPAASGLLPIALGEATKVLSYLSKTDKRYRATLALGSATDTLDAAGREIARAPIPVLVDEQIIATLDRFKGEIDQLPPMYSAVHHQGRRLYEFARNGIEVTRSPRRVHIHTIELIDRGSDCIQLDIVCSAGTYIRTLADDLARALGTVGHLRDLVRTEAAGWRLHEAIALDKIDRSTLAQRVIPLEHVLARFLKVEVGADAGARLSHGQVLRDFELAGLGLRSEKPQVVWFRPVTGEIHALARTETDKNGTVSMKILRLLYPSRPSPSRQ